MGAARTAAPRRRDYTTAAPQGGVQWSARERPGGENAPATSRATCSISPSRTRERQIRQITRERMVINE